MSAQNNGGPAFPDSVAIGPAGDLYGATGMTLRDYFAAKAMPIIMQQTDHIQLKCDSGERRMVLATAAYLHADAMIAARSK